MSGYSPLVAITTVDTISTFDDWRVLTNQTISRVNNAVSSNTASDYSELISRLVVRDETASFVANNISGNNFTANVSYFFLANGEMTSTNTVVSQSGVYVGSMDPATQDYSSNATVDPITDPSGLRSLVCRTTDAILLPRGTAGQAPINAEPGMIRYDTTMGTLTYWNPSTISWKTLGGGELGDRDVDTVITVENAPGTDEDTISMYVGNTGTAFPVFTINAATTNTSVNAVFRDFVLFEKDITISGNLTVLGQQSSVDATSLAIEDKRINIGLVNGLRNECVGLPDGANLRVRMPVIDTTTGTGAQVPHGLNVGELVWVTNINDIQNLVERLYVVEAVHDIYEFSIKNTDGSAIGAIVGTFSPTISWSGPQTDSSVSGGGFVLPGNTEHSIQWMDTDQYFVSSDSMRINNTGAFGLPNGNTNQRPSSSLGPGSGDNDYIADHKGLIRFNNELNTIEALITGGGGGATRTWVDVRGMIDNDDGADTFINVYGNHQNPTALVSAAGHTLNDIVFVTAGVERFFIDALGYAHFTSNAGLVLPKGNTGEQPRFPSLDTGSDTTNPLDSQGDGMQVGMIRYNTELNVYEGVFTDDSSTDNLRFMPLASHGIVDTGSNSANDTFLNIYGNDSDPFSHDPSGTHVGIQGNAVHTLDDVILTVAGTKRLFIDSTGWAAFTSNGVLGIPRGTTAERPTNVAGGYDAGMIRFNTDLNSFEGVLADGLTWAGLGGVVDSADGADTFLNVYGNAGNPTAISPDASHVLNDMVFVTAGSEEMKISANSWIHMSTSANSVMVIPVGTTAQRPSSTDNGYMAGAIRFNSSINSFEGVLADGTTWAGLGGVVDSANDGDTFIQVYGNVGDATAITPDAAHNENDMVFVTNTNHIMTITHGDASNYGNVFIGATYDTTDTSHKSNAPDAQFKVVGTANITGVVVFNDTFTVNGAVDFDSTLNVDENVTFQENLAVTNAISGSNTLTIAGNTDLNGSKNDLAGILNVSGATNLGSTLGVTGVSTLSANLNVTGDITASANLSITGFTTLTDNVVITNNLAVQGDIIEGNDLLKLRATNDDNDYVQIDSNSIDLVVDASQRGQFTSTGLSVAGVITCSGDITAFSSSDQRKKENILNIPDALEKVESLNGVTFDFKEGMAPEGRSGRQVGMIAQEVMEVLPDVVRQDNDGFYGMEYDRVVPLLVEAIKDLSKKVKELEERE